MTPEEIAAALAAKDAEVAALAAKAKELETAHASVAAKHQELEAALSARIKAEVARRAGWPDALANDLAGKNEEEWLADAKRRVAMMPKSGAPAPVPGPAVTVPPPDRIAAYKAQLLSQRYL